MSQATQCNGFSEESGKVAMYDMIDKADKGKGIAASRRKREVHKRSKEASKTSQQQQVKEDILQSEAPSKKAEKERQEKEERQGPEQSAMDPFKREVGESLGMEGDRKDSRSGPHIPEIPDDMSMKISYPQSSKDIISVNRKMKQVRVMLTSKDTVRGVTAEADVAHKEISRENSNDIEAREVVWAECNEELSSLVNQISEQLGTEVEEEDKEGDHCAKEESADVPLSQEVTKLDEAEDIEFNPEWIKDAARGGQRCYVHIKNECYATFYGDELLKKVKKGATNKLKDQPKDRLNKSAFNMEAHKEGTIRKRICTFRQEKAGSKEEDSFGSNEKRDDEEGDEQARPTSKRKRSSEDSEEEGIIHPRRKRGAVKYNCDSSDEESDKDNESKDVDMQVARPRKSVSLSSGGAVECWSSKVFSNDYKDSCQVGFKKST